jgi:hypothetical protein
VGFFESRTHLQFTPGTWISDIHGDTPGAGTGHRSIAPLPVGRRSLSPRVRPLLPKQLYETSFLGMGIMAGPDLRGFLAAAQLDPRGLLHAAKRTTRHLAELAVFREGQYLANGAALVARLLQSADDLGVAVHVGTAARSLLTDGTGRVRGAVLEGPDGTRVVESRRGVVFAAGGFPADTVRRTAELARGTGPGHRTIARARPPVTGCGWESGPADTWIARVRPRSPGARSRSCPTATATPACSRTSSTAASPT